MAFRRKAKFCRNYIKVILKNWRNFGERDLDKQPYLGGIPVRWFPASWTLRERKQREKFQAVIHDIPVDMTMATLWADRKPQLFLTMCGACAFKIIQTSKGKRKLVGYFENWEATLKALGTPQAFPRVEMVSTLFTYLEETTI
ncbi:hypothetical protein GLOIN_2v1773466 [Rhizophagus irregularis DAOM 181602=DAOM 197198]|uniref:Uncharacterized protein n=1 Tax=Rhizophagus irregularis (strain DAOM 197198w) TaxID=1432141 RepID=A0A015JIP7_RHIIW|nr:hypothetical protein RirG_118230 [Rhizophagus irregularis DAOM 197198w]GBC20055.2 hypothetical protein GLOIN_2v1773466 [Rhizophagus irregularis DAOM 181602=DAOM 197198]